MLDKKDEITGSQFRRNNLFNDYQNNLAIGENNEDRRINQQININNENNKIPESVERETFTDPKLEKVMKDIVEGTKGKKNLDSELPPQSGKQSKLEQSDEKKEGLKVDEQDELIKRNKEKKNIERKKEFKHIFNKEMTNINVHRRNLLHCIVVVAVIDCIIWEIDCLFLNVCYGEEKEMEKWVSSILFPLIILNILLLYFLYVSANYLKRVSFKVCIGIISLFAIICIIFGIIQILKGGKKSNEHSEKIIEELTGGELEYYSEIGKNWKKDSGFDEKTYVIHGIFYKYKLKMILSGSLNLLLGVLSIIIIIISVIFNSLLAQSKFDWRPPLRSHVRESRIIKAIKLYIENSETYRKLFLAENPGFPFGETEIESQRLNNLKSNINLDKESQVESRSLNINNKSQNIQGNPENEIKQQENFTSKNNNFPNNNSNINNSENYNMNNNNNMSNNNINKVNYKKI